MAKDRCKTTARIAEAVDKAVEAMELRKAGASFVQIGKQLGFSTQHAHRLVTKELARMNAELKEVAGDVTRLELERLDAMWLGLWTRARQGDDKAVVACLRIMERRAKILGIDAPLRQELTGADGGPIQTVDVDLSGLSVAELKALTVMGEKIAQPLDSASDGGDS